MSPETPRENRASLAAAALGDTTDPAAGGGPSLDEMAEESAASAAWTAIKNDDEDGFKIAILDLVRAFRSEL